MGTQEDDGQHHHPLSLLEYINPIGWNNVIPYGEYVLNQGNRALGEQGSEDTQEIGGVPAGAQAFVLEAQSDRLLLFEQVERNVPQDGKVVRAMVFAQM